jgi:TonB family protein
MSAIHQRYRRNFVLAIVIHIAAILGVIFWEQFGFNTDVSARPVVELVVPADILGELPAGTGTGRGAYKAPEPAGGGDAPEPVRVPAPAPAKVSSPTPAGANEIALPAKKSTSPATKPTPAAKTIPKKPTTTIAKSTSPASKGSGAGSSEEIRNRFAKALTSSADGTPYGDGRAAGGGKATGGRIGSPDGAADGMVGGVGQGTPNWRYFQHVHDILYDAWEQPGRVTDKRLITMVALRIARDGSIADAQVRVGSGNKLMDDSVLAAVRRVARLDPPPIALVRGEHAIVTVDFQIEG